MRLIDVDNLIDDCKRYLATLNPDRDGKECTRIHWLIGVLNNAPSAQPERKRGKWIVGSEFEDCIYAKCNQCKVTQVFYYNKPLTNFCPNCGADMRGEQDGRNE